MKEALVDLEAAVYPRVSIVDSPIPTPAAGQVVIKVVAASLNPKDYKHKSPGTINQGDDVAGVVHLTGDNVTEFKVGDRVAAFHQMGAPHGAFAEYAVTWAYTTFHIPESVSFEEASTIPLAGLTAALGLYQSLRLTPPWLPETESHPFVVYGGGSAVGAFAVKLAKLSNLHPLIVVAGKSGSQIETLLDRSQGDVVIDYREGDTAVVSKLRTALNGQPLLHAFDAITEFNSYQNLAQIIDPQAGRITTIQPVREDRDKFPPAVDVSFTFVGRVHGPVPEKKDGNVTLGNREFAAVFSRFFGQGLRDGFWSGHPWVAVPRGLEGLEQALGELKDWKSSYSKHVVRIADTPGVEA
ncbi:alcohol dehydrogenase [Aspergillus steynii IBT 23096]|uniref:Alcohol dehydrogenase n=1 Tax=Aspergillus steynii IBT 23096 TaxID=1392250 RepID=A0A2I2GIM6_9EURO|nr:alcohol dehydrogenase [Aspergillus steynii IBT 23096]PLB52729.1 alcohol dehydrogenase [Aspergillus steynii IBT 23096]